MSANNNETTVFDNLSEKQQDHITSILEPAKIMIWDLYAKQKGIKFEDFKYDETCIGFIEQYLIDRVRPNILKWKYEDLSITVTRVKKRNGTKSNKDEHIQEFLNLVKICAVIYGQCIATILDGKWNLEDGLHVDVAGTPFAVYWKCLKFVTLGDEDSLSGCLAFLKHQELNFRIQSTTLDALKLSRSDYGHIQCWAGETGIVDRMVVLDPAGEIIKDIYIEAINS